jgi:hypothetical protein
MLDHNIKECKDILIDNALDDGWTIKQQNNQVILTKKHEGKKEKFRGDFLNRFMKNVFNKKYRA